MRQISPTQERNKSDRHRCRQCQGKLRAPTEIPTRAFCTPFCWQQFYRHRCVVCESPIRRKSAQQRRCISKKCRSDYRRYPHIYRFSGLGVGNWTQGARSARKTGLKTRHAATPSLPVGLRHWHWDQVSGDDDDWRLINGKGEEVARVRQEGDRYWVAYPRAIPEPPLETWVAAQHRAVSLALACIERPTLRQPGPHPLGRPSYIAPVAFRTDWRPTGSGVGMPDIPDFLDRNSRCDWPAATDGGAP